MLGGGRTKPLANGTNGLESLSDRFPQFTAFSAYSEAKMIARLCKEVVCHPRESA